MYYDPIKKSLGQVFNRTPWLRRLFLLARRERVGHFFLTLTPQAPPLAGGSATQFQPV